MKKAAAGQPGRHGRMGAHRVARGRRPVQRWMRTPGRGPARTTSPFSACTRELSASLEKVKRGQAKVFIGDIGRRLGDYLAGRRGPRRVLPDRRAGLALPGGRVPGHLAAAVAHALPAGGKLAGHGGKPLRGGRYEAGHLRLPPGGLHHHAARWRRKARSPRRRATCTSCPRTGAAGRASSSSRRRFFTRRAAANPKYAEAARRSGLDNWHQAPRPAAAPGTSRWRS